MKIERINENQIRCTLSSFDLSVRNLNLGELAYGTEKARNLFREMIQKASNEVGFEAEDIPLMVEAIPLSNESVMLVITKIEDPEELDTRFSRFSPMPDDEGSLFSNLANELLEGADGLLERLATTVGNKSDGQAEETSDKTDSSSRIYTFSHLDTIIEAAHSVGSACKGQNTLYKNPRTGQYYLIIHSDSPDSLEFSRILNVLAEYGSKVKFEYAVEAYYKEHYETIIEDHALQSLFAV
ncbi:adaptor protein MecA [Lachnospiraceae bacterium 62-35]